MIKAVIFDVGGVLIRTEDRSQRQNLEKEFNLSNGQSDHLVFNSDMGQKAQKGEISDQELWAWIAEQLQPNEDIHDFQDRFWAGDELDETLIDFIRALQTSYQTAIISNATDALRESLTDKHKIANAFDLIVVSAEEMVMKPDPEIYQITLDKLDRQPEECIFIDDFAHNVDAARELGFSAIHFRPGMDLPRALAAYDVKPR